MSTSSRSGLPGRLGQVSDDQKERQGVDHQEGKGSQIVRPLSGKMTQNSPQEYGRANRRSWKYCVGHKKGPAPFDVEPTPDRRFLLCSDCVSQSFSQCLPLRLCSGFSCVHLTSPRCITQCCPRVFALVSPAPHTRFRHAIRSVCQCLSHGFSCDPPLCP